MNDTYIIFTIPKSSDLCYISIRIKMVIELKKVIKYLDKPLLIVTMLLFIVGLIMVFSSSNVTAYMSHAVSPYNYFIKQAVFLVVGLILFIFMIGRKTRTYGILSWFLILIGIGSLVLLLVIGKAKNRAVSWFDLGFVSVQPSEFIKIIAIVWLSYYFDIKRKKLDNYTTALFPIFICGIIAALIFLQPDLGTTIIFCLIVAILFCASPISKEVKYKSFFGIVGLVMFMGVILLSTGKTLILERQLERFNFTRPCDRLLDTGSQVCNGYIAINNGGLTGVGLGNSTQKYLYLPEPYTDFIFAVIVEELGSIFGIGIILAYMFILYRILSIGRKSHKVSGTLMCYGVAVYIFLHIAVNLMGIFGLMPMTGVPLPFMSYGGSFTVCLVAALTIVQRVSVENGLNSEKSK